MSEPQRLRLGTRGSSLALTQSRWVARRIEEAGAVRVEPRTIRTTGDLMLDQPLSRIGGKGLFTSELDRALLDGAIDLAVHSLKDLPTDLPEGIALGAIPEREDPSDVLIAARDSGYTLETLPPGARVGTSSLRRAALVRAHRSDLLVEDIRGNLDTRIRKVDDGAYDAIVVACAGVRRMRQVHRISEFLDPGGWLPAPGQGALAVAVRSDDLAEADWLRRLDHPPSRSAVTAERAVLRTLEGGCSLPVAALALPFGGGLRLRGLVAHPDGRRMVRAELTGAQDDPSSLGRAVAERLLALGADRILADPALAEPEASRARGVEGESR